MSAGFAADYFDGRSLRRHAVRVEIGDAVAIRGDGIALDAPRAAIALQPLVGRTPARLALPGGGLLVVADPAGLERALGATARRSLAHRLESHLGFMLFGWACLAAAVAFAYVEGVPWVAREATSRISPEQELRLGEGTLRALDRRGLGPSTLEPGRRAAIAAEFAALRSAAGGALQARLEFRDEKDLKNGPAAFATPGFIVVGDGMAAMLDDAQLAAVMAHELGHLHHRHTLHRIVANSLQALGALLLYGDVSAIAAIGPFKVAASAYSRRFEREADAFAFDLLRRTGRSPQDFASAMATLRRELLGPPRVTRFGVEPPRDPQGTYLSTHPSFAEREAAAAAASPGKSR